MKRLTSIIAAALMATACVDDLDQMPHIESTAASVYTSAENYKGVLAKLYAAFVINGQEKGGGNADLSSNNGQDYLRDWFNLQEDGTDELACVWLEGDKVNDLTYINWDSNDPWVADFYYRAYYNILLCNEFLRNATDGSISGFSETEQADIRNYRAEARFLRAMCYSHLMDLFVELPFVTEADGVGSFIPPVYTRTQIFDYVEADLKAIADGTDGLPDSNEYARATKPAAWTLLAKNYLNAQVYTGTERYTDCITYCQKIMSAGYQLESNYSLLFNADNHKRTNEIIFPFAVDADHTTSWGATTLIVCGSVCSGTTMNIANYGIQSDWSMFRARGAFADKFMTDGVLNTNDSRCLLYTDGQTQYIVKAPDKDQTQGYPFEKYTNLTDLLSAASNSADDGVCTDFPLMRLADVHLMLAESVLRGGSGATQADALAAVNQLRQRAYGDDSGNITAEQLTLPFILDERARELYLECTRRTDLIRFGLFTSAEYLWEWKGGVQEGKAVDNKFNHYPVPVTELSANPNIINAGY